MILNVFEYHYGFLMYLFIFAHIIIKYCTFRRGKMFVFFIVPNSIVVDPVFHTRLSRNNEKQSNCEITVRKK